MSASVSDLHQFGSFKLGVLDNARFWLVLNLLLLMTPLASVAQVPTIVVEGPSNILSSSLSINATVNPNGLATAVYLQWGTSTTYDQIGMSGHLDPQDTPVPVFLLMTGLAPNTLYHYQVVATNSAGMSVSPDMMVTSGNGPGIGLGPPGLLLLTATDITSNSATISATVTTTNWPTFFYVLWGTTPAYDHSSSIFPVPSQSSAVPVSTTLSNLASNTTYHYQFIATNSGGASFSADLTFTTLSGSPPGAPVIVVNGPSNILATSLSINATVNPNGLATTVYLQWGTSTTYDHIGMSGHLDPQDTSVPVFLLMTGLTPTTLYHYQVVATNVAGTSVSPDMAVTAGVTPGSPGLSLISASDITSTTATINATIDPKNLPTGFYVLWGTTAAYDHNGRVASIPSQSSPVAVSTTLSNLAPKTTYHYQMVATNSAGMSSSADMTFTTLDGAPPPPLAPVATTSWSWSITGTSAAIDGIVAPNGFDTTCYFRWGATTAYGNTTPTSVATANYVQTFTTAWLTGLNPGTTYHYQFVATNINGVSIGDDATFTTLNGVYIGDHLFVYTTNNGTITITSYSGPGGVVPIPDQITGLPVTSIGTAAFAGSGVTSVIIPKSVTSIESVAFTRSSLTNLVVPGNVTNIASEAFNFCSDLTDVTIENGVVTLGSQAFGWCSKLAKITIPDSVTTIEDGLLTKAGPAGLCAFCPNLTNATIGAGLSYLGTGAFMGCPNLVSVLFRGNAPVEGLFWAIDHTAFRWDDAATVYYLPGTAGWGDTYAGRPAVLWAGQAQGADAGLTMQPGGFAFTIRGPANSPVLIEATTNLAAPSWVPLQTCMLTNGVLHFLDLESSNYPARFYRIRSP